MSNNIERLRCYTVAESSRHGQVRIKAEWMIGGPYIDLTFNGGTPSEVINVWNYITNTPEIQDQHDLARAVRAWIEEEYAEEARYEGRPGEWLSTYLENK